VVPPESRRAASAQSDLHSQSHGKYAVVKLLMA